LLEANAKKLFESRKDSGGKPTFLSSRHFDLRDLLSLESLSSRRQTIF
jgi:hypothetical protein